MTKDETTKAIERTGNKVIKEKIKSQVLEDKREGVSEIKESNDKELEGPGQENKTKSEEKKVVKEIKKEEAFVRAYNIPISTKHSSAISKFIKGKTIERARKDLEDVIKFKKAVPMKGEIPHRRGKIMSGRFPQKAVKNFLVLLKSLEGNAANINVPVIVESIANIGERPYGKFGRVRKKRTHIYIKVVEKSKLKEINKKPKRKSK